MTRDDATELLRQLVGFWPSTKLTDELAAYWLAMLERLPFEVGTETAKMAVTEFRWFPSVAEWQALARRARGAHADVRGLPEPPKPRPDKAYALEQINACRDTLARANKPMPRSR